MASPFGMNLMVAGHRASRYWSASWRAAAAIRSSA
jgi:hypothetical protein